MLLPLRLSSLITSWTLGLLGAAALMPSAHGENSTWINSGTGDWFDAGNWSTGLVPSSTTTAKVTNGGTLQITSGSASVTNLTLGDPSGVMTGNGKLTVDGGYLQTPISTIDQGSLATLNSGTWWTGDGNIGYAGSGTLVQNGGLYTPASLIIGYGPGTKGTVLINGGTLQTAGAISLATNGQGTLTINNGLMAAQTIILGSGTLTVGSSDTAKAILQVNVISLNQTSSLLVIDGGILKATQNQANFISSTRQSVRLTEKGGTIDTQAFTIGIKASFSGVGPLIKVGSGTLVLSGSNFYSGATDVQEGTLQLGQSGTAGLLFGAAQVEAGTSLTGEGTVRGDATVAGTLNPGAASSGTLIFNKQLLLQDAMVRMDLTSATAFDRIQASGLLTYDGTLLLVLADGFLPNVGDTFQLFLAGTTTGLFCNIAFTSQGYTGTMNYSTGTLTVTGVPEPASLAWLGLVSGALAWVWRARRA